MFPNFGHQSEHQVLQGTLRFKIYSAWGLISIKCGKCIFYALSGTENVEPAPLQACWNLVAASRRERKQKEDEKRKEEAERKWEEEKLWQQAKNQRKTSEGAAGSTNHSQDNSDQPESGKDTQNEAGNKSTNEKPPLSEDKGQGSNPDKTGQGAKDIPSSVSLDGILSAIAEEEEVNSQAGPPS